MAKETPPAVAKAREQRQAKLQVLKPNVRLRPLKPGPRATNNCLTLLVMPRRGWPRCPPRKARAAGLHPALRRAGIRQVHSNPHITFTVYAHAIPKERHGAGDALARLTAQSGNKMETSIPEAGSAA
jgi:hypothetical protein